MDFPLSPKCDARDARDARDAPPAKRRQLTWSVEPEEPLIHRNGVPAHGFLPQLGDDVVVAAPVAAQVAAQVAAPAPRNLFDMPLPRNLFGGVTLLERISSAGGPPPAPKKERKPVEAPSSPVQAPLPPMAHVYRTPPQVRRSESLARALHLTP